MDIDAFLHRTPLAGHPLSLIVRPPAGGSLEESARRARELLANRNPLDEVLILPPPPPQPPPPALPPSGEAMARFPGARAVLPRDGQTPLETALRASRWPIVVLWSPEIPLAPAQFRAVVRLLDDCDLVAGKRARSTRWWSWGAEWLARWVFGVPLADPLCPLKVIRKAAVQRLKLQLGGALEDFELVAKMTFLTSLMDECVVPARERPKPLLAALARNPLALAAMFFRPRFWQFDKGARSRRDTLNQDTTAPRLPLDANPVPLTACGARRPIGRRWGPSYPRSSLRRQPRRP